MSNSLSRIMLLDPSSKGSVSVAWLGVVFRGFRRTLMRVKLASAWTRAQDFSSNRIGSLQSSCLVSHFVLCTL